jgi:hypothetical protein
MLSTPRTFGEIARVGPIRRQATKVTTLLSDPVRTGYLAVALPEEMPVNETLELDVRLRDAVGLGLDAIVVNGLYPDRFSAAEVDALRTAAANGLPPNGAEAIRVALAEHDRARGQRTQLRRLRREADGPAVYTLPFLFDPDIGLEQYGRLAADLGRKL